MPKKPVRNAFYFFMKELEPQLRREGRVFPNGMADVVPIAHPRWRSLPDKERERFEQMAKKAKGGMRGREGDKYRVDNVGNILADRKDIQVELDKRRKQDAIDIRSGWPPGNEVSQEQFYLINIQYMCKIEDSDAQCQGLDTNDIFIPCEIAIIEYSVEKGITKKLHRFIQPGRIPSGFKYTCISHSEETHQIPVESFELADDNYRGLWIQIENFINPNGEKPDYPPVYCLGSDKSYKVVEYCLQWIHGKACVGMPNRIRKVYEVESLLLELHAHIGNQVSKSGCIELLTSTDWDYEPNTRCDYHEEKEVRHCSLGIVNRFAYALSDNLCTRMDVTLTTKHLPMHTDANAVTVLSPSAMPVASNQESRMPQRNRNQNQNYSQPLYTRPKVEPQPARRRFDDENDDYDDDYTPLRTPNIPGFGGGMAGVAGTTPAANPWGAMGGVAVPPMQNSTDFPPMGRGLSVGMDAWTTVEGKHAGRAAPPTVVAAPIPPTTWQRDVFAQQPVGIGRGLMMASPDVHPQRAPVAQVQTSVPDMPPPAQQHEANGESFDPRGRGRGGILEHIMKHGVKPGVPMGRGYAPPDWVDDGSMGVPLRR